MAVRIVLGLFLLVTICSAKNRDWQLGTILEGKAAEADLGNVYPVTHGRSFDFTPKTGLETNGRSWIVIPNYGVRETYVIVPASGPRVIATRLLQSDKPSEFSKMHEVKFAVSKGRVFLLDAKGREHQFKRVDK